MRDISRLENLLAISLNIEDMANDVDFCSKNHLMVDQMDNLAEFLDKKICETITEDDVVFLCRKLERALLWFGWQYAKKQKDSEFIHPLLSYTENVSFVKDFRDALNGN